MERTTIVDPDKSIDSLFRENMEFYYVILDVHHVKKNILPYIGLQRSSGPSFYEREFYAPCVEEFEEMQRQYGEKTATYLQKFRYMELYGAQ